MGLSATSHGNVHVIIEELIASSEDMVMLDFKSEYEFTSGDSTMNGKIVMLDKGADIIGSITEKCKEYYNSRPIICILEKE